MSGAIPPPSAAPSPVIPVRGQVVAFLTVLILCLSNEALRWFDPALRNLALTRWLCGENADWLPFLPWLIAAPLFWTIRSRRRPAVQDAEESGASPERSSPPPVLHAALAVLVAAVSFGMSLWVSDRFGDVPPAYHDEFSYLFQARTFLAGRFWFPSFEPMPELFDQMHVLNEGRFASRYFPGTGLWLAPFVAFGHPWLGHWIAGALAAAFVYGIGREVGGTVTGLIAGLAAALSPGLALFSNLLLAHHPTLAGLTLFIWMFLRCLRTGGKWAALLASLGLAFAMLCRPMTAFGVSLPFGAYFAWWLLTGRGGFDPARPEHDTPAHAHSPWRSRLALALAMGGPIFLGLGAIAVQNRAITGDALTTPYQVYTDVYTPRHVYGFNNVERGEERLGPKVLDNYDRWAENLTPRLALENVRTRLTASLRWTLGIVPLAFAAIALGFSRGVVSVPIRLVGWAVVSIHAVHIPYWFEGIMGWHYVFESAPLWLVIFAEASRRLRITWRATGRRAMTCWWTGLIVTACAVNLVTVPSLWPGRLSAGIDEVAFSRNRYARFDASLEAIRQGKPVIVFVEHDPAERHIDYVANDPALKGPVLIARHRPGRTDLAAARALFPDRDAYLFHAATGEWEKLP